MQLRTLVAIGAWVFSPAPVAQASQLLANSGFESPLAVASTCSGSPIGCLFLNVGDTIPGWTVVQGPGSVQTLNVVDVLASNYQEGSLLFDPEEGNQSLDLTGNFNQGPNGVSQTVATVAGAGYTLSFWAGNQDNAQGSYPLFSSVALYVNGVLVGPFTTTGNTAGNVAWQNFTFSFTADGSGLTTVAFINNTPGGDNFTGLDNVTLTGPSAVPEPGNLGLAAIAFGCLWAGRRRACER